jgi:hypothetical protein
MITPADKEYKLTKQIMLGQKTMNPDFVELADWINRTYQVKTVNIIYDTFISARRKQSRLQICFEFEFEALKFRDKPLMNFHTDKQSAIAEKFKEILTAKKSKNQARSAPYTTENLLVVFSAFEPVAREEAVNNIPQEKVKELQKHLNNPELWEISKAFGRTTFFLYTEAQVKKYQDSQTRKDWAKKYFELLDQYNEFGYFKPESFSIALDSKENFDNNYESNWYYYYK